MRMPDCGERQRKRMSKGDRYNFMPEDGKKGKGMVNLVQPGIKYAGPHQLRGLVSGV
jgi:hypothetical protein